MDSTSRSRLTIHNQILEIAIVRCSKMSTTKQKSKRYRSKHIQSRTTRSTTVSLVPVTAYLPFLPLSVT